MASSPSVSSSSSTAAGFPQSLIKEMKSHEVAVAELSNLPSSRTVYQKNGIIFFRTTTQLALAFEQKQLNMAKANSQKLNLP